MKTLPKILHLYWGRNRSLSFLRAGTVYTFLKLNPDWVIWIHYPKMPKFFEGWKTGEQQHSRGMINDHFRELGKMPRVSLVQYDNEYTSWSPKDVFEKAYREVVDFDFLKQIDVYPSGDWNFISVDNYQGDCCDDCCESIN